jgi:hypothetical protein
MNDKSFDEIIEYLFVGSKNALNDKEFFYMIVNCTLELCKDSVNLYIDDDPKTLVSQIYETRILERIHDCIENRRPVLVYCGAGMQRSCAVVACYLLQYYDINPREAVEFIQGERCVAFFGSNDYFSAIDLFHYFIHFSIHVS